MLVFVPQIENRRRLLALIVATLITILWAVGFLINIVNPNYNPPASLTPLMLSAAAYLFAGDVLSRKGGPSGE